MMDKAELTRWLAAIPGDFSIAIDAGERETGRYIEIGGMPTGDDGDDAETGTA